MSQAKISRTETGSTLPSVIDVERILAALDVPEEIARELLELARTANVDYTAWRTFARLGLHQKQAELARVSEKPNVDIAIIPQTVQVPVTPMNIFVIYDDRLVTVELFSGEVVLRTPQDISHHIELFELFMAHALTGAEAKAFLLDRADEFMRERE